MLFSMEICFFGWNNYHSGFICSPKGATKKGNALTHIYPDITQDRNVFPWESCLYPQICILACFPLLTR